MASIKSSTHVLAGLGLATVLFLGCQDFLSQNASNSSVTVTDQNPESVSLRLAIKDSGACLELKDRIVAAHAAGTEPGGSDSAFAANCIREVIGADTAKVLPPAMIPDDRTRCRWIRTQIDVGRDEMTIKFRHYCPDDCDTLLDKDSTEHVKYCRDPKHDSAGVKPPEHDTGAVKPPDHDTVPPRNLCDSLHIMMMGTVPGTQIHKDQEADFKLRCVEPPHDSVKEPPHDTAIVKPPVILPPIVPPKPNCDSLRLMLSKLDTASADYARIKHLMGETCPMPKPVIVPVVPPTVNCDELRAKLALIDSTSLDFARLQGSLREHCPTPAP